MAAQREWFEKDYYKVLGVGDDAVGRRTSPRPTASWRASCIPTRTPATPPPRSASRRSSAATTCSATRPSARSTTRSAGSARSAAGGGPVAGRAGSRFNVGDMPTAPASATCSGRCSAAAGAAAGRRPASGRAAAPTSQATLTLDFADAVRGITTTLHLTSDAQCSHVPRLAAPSRARSRRCARSCGGRGVIDDNQGLFSFSSPCRAAAAPARSSRTRARRATARVSSAAPARCRRASRPA